MPVTLMITPREADFLAANNVDGVAGDKFTYSPVDTGKIIKSLPEGDERDFITGRLAEVATQLGIPEVMFADTTPAAEPEKEVEPELPLEVEQSEEKPKPNKKQAS